MSSDPSPFPHVNVHTFGDDPKMKPDSPPKVVIDDGGVELHLYFAGRSGDAKLTELCVKPVEGDELDPAAARQIVPRLHLFLATARASLAWNFDDARSAARMLREVGRPGRGLPADFFRLIAHHHRALVAEGEKYPVKALSEIYHVSLGAASRWVTEARRRGYLPPKGER